MDRRHLPYLNTRWANNLLLRRGAFEQGIEQHQEHADAVAEIEEERESVSFVGSGENARTLARIALLVLFIVITTDHSVHY